jgi:hypothetical protein
MSCKTRLIRFVEFPAKSNEIQFNSPLDLSNFLQYTFIFPWSNFPS